MEEKTTCDVCGKPAGKRCAKCFSVVYCSKEHQAIGWKKHKKVCRPFKIHTNTEPSGYHLVATRPLQREDVIFETPPLLLAPLHLKSPICLGCHKNLELLEMCLCQKCGWPVCNEQCEENPNHKPECYYFTKRRNKVSPGELKNYHDFLVMVLRCLYHKQFNTEIWQKIDRLGSCRHLNEVQQEQTFEMLIKDLRTVINMKKFAMKDIRKVFTIVIVHSIRIGPDIIGIYQIASLFEHNCRANCSRMYNSATILRFTAAMPIAKGDRLSINHIPTLLTTFQRQVIIQQEQCYTCQCDKCRDATEFGTYCSALKCRDKNCDGLLLPETFLVKGLDWICNKCNRKIEADNVNNIYKSAAIAFQTAKSMGTIDAFLSEYTKILSNYNYCIIDAKLLTLFIVKSNYGIKGILDDDLEQRIKFFREIIPILQKVCPADLELRIHTLPLFHSFLAETYQRKDESENFNFPDRLLLLKECRVLLKEIVDITSFQYGVEQVHNFSKNDLKIVEEMLTVLDT